MLRPGSPCDALNNPLRPCEASDSVSVTGVSISASPTSKGARRKQRAKRSILQSLGFGCPPGLVNYENSDKDETKTELVELARRVTRMELLLFSTPDDAFAALDKHIATILCRESELGGDEEDSTTSSVSIPQSCEVFCMSDDTIAHGEDGVPMASITEVSESSVCSSIEHQVDFDTKITKLEKDLAALRHCYEDSLFGKQFKQPASIPTDESINQTGCVSMSAADEPAVDADWTFLEQQLEMCLESMQGLFANMEPICEKREDVLDDIVDAGMSAIQVSMKSDRARESMKLYESRVRSEVKRRISSMMP